MSQDLVESLAARLWEAEQTHTPIPPMTDAYPHLTVADAYAIQLHNVARRRQRARVVGKKIGLTSKAMQDLLGVSEPDYGHLFSDMVIPEGGSFSVSRLLQPRVEGEIAFVLDRRLRGPGVTVSDVLSATRGVMPALEIVDCRIRNWAIKIQDTVADNGASAMYVLGRELTPVHGLDLRLVGMVLEQNNQMVGTGAGAAVQGHPAQAVAWLANKLADFDVALEEGEVILSGSLTVAPYAKPGDRFTASFDRLGSVTVHVTE